MATKRAEPIDGETFVRAYARVSKAGGSYNDLAQELELPKARVTRTAMYLRLQGVNLPSLRRTHAPLYDFKALKALSEALLK